MRRWVVLLVAAACFERGGKRPPAVADDARAAERDAATANVVGPTTPDPSLVVRIALDNAPPSLHPLDGHGARFLIGDVYEGLLCEAGGGREPGPCLAETVAVDEAGRRWDITLRDVRFHDGTTMTALDVAASLDAARDPERSPLAADLFDIDRIDVIATGRLRVIFAGDRPGRAEAIARAPIVPAKRIAALAPGTNAPPPSGTGPYRIDKVGVDRIELARNDRYWGEPAIADRVAYVVTVDRDDAIRRLERGDVDVVFGVSPDRARSIDDASVAVVAFGYVLPANVVAIYDARRALADPDHRRALTALLDRASIGRDVLGTGGAPPTSPFPDGDPGVDTTIAAVPFDRVLAARLLGDARPVLDVLVPAGSRGMARVADIWASDARGLATLTPRELPFTDVLARLREGTFDIALLSMTTGPDLDLWPQLSSKAPPDTAWTGVRDRVLDDLLERVRGEPDRDKRAAIRKDLHRRLGELEPFALIARDRRLGLARRDVGGLGATSHGVPPARRLYRGRR